MKIIIAALLLGVCLTLYSSNSPVIQLTSTNFQKEVVDSSDIWIIEFYGISYII